MESRSAKPSELTAQFLRLVHEGIGNHTGFFQIVEFHKKREKYYSANISDGYFKCKVIFRQEPSSQIDKGQIKLFSILYGTVSNQGNRLLMVGKKLLCWDFHRTIGIIRNWKDEAPNIYINGSNLIEWASQSHIEDQTPVDLQNQSAISTISMSSYCGTEIPQKNKAPNDFTYSNRKVRNRFGEEIKSRKQSMESSFSFGSHGLGSSHSEAKDSSVHSKNSKQQMQRTQSLDLNTKQTKATNDFSNSRQIQPQNNRKLMVVPESQSQHTSNSKSAKKRKLISQIPQRLSQAFSRDESSLKIASSVAKSSGKARKSEFKDKISMLFDDGEQPTDPDEYQDEDLYSMLHEFKRIKQDRINNMLEQQANAAQPHIAKSIPKKQTNVSLSKGKRNTLQELLQLDSRSQTVISSNNKQNQQCLQITKMQPQTPLKPISPDKPLLSSEPESSELQIKQILLQSQQKTNSLYSNQKEVRANDLSLTNGPSNAQKWLTVRILCSKFVQENNQTKKLCVAEQFSKHQHGNIFNILLANAEMYNPFEDGSLYQLSLAHTSVVEPNVEQMFVQMELRAKSQDIKARKLPNALPPPAKAPHYGYVSIDRVESIREGVSINVVGIVSKYKNISNKKKGGAWTNIFTLISYESGASVDFTIFDVHKLTAEPNSPTVIYNALVKSYQGRKTLNFRNYTLYYFGAEALDRFTPHIPQLAAIGKWLAEGNNVGKIINKLDKFAKVQSLLQAQSLARHSATTTEQLKIQIPQCRVVKLSPYFFVLLCDSCNKKLMRTSCFTCGRREHPLKQYQLSLQIADNSHSFYIEFNHYDSMGYIGEEGEKYDQFCREIMHRRVRLWLIMNPKYRAVVVRMEVLAEGDLVKGDLAKLRALARYI